MTVISKSPTSFITQLLQPHFPKEAFSAIKKDPDAKRYVLHFYLMLDQPDLLISEWLKTCNKKYRDYINQPHDLRQVDLQAEKWILPTGLPPLSLAVLMERVTVVDALCSSSDIQLERKDGKGWSSLQHAIVKNNPLILERLERAIDERFGMRTNVVSTLASRRFPFLRKMVRDSTLENFEEQQDEKVVVYQDENKVLHSLSQTEFGKIRNGALFYDGVIASSEAIFFNWYNRASHSEDPMILWMGKRYESYLKNKPKLFLSHVQGGSGVGVRAGEPIPFAALATIFGSKVVVSSPIPDFHLPAGVPGKKISSYGGMIQDGFPNIVEFPLIIDGVELRGFIASRDIQPGEQLFRNYGYTHPIKKECSQLAIEEAIKAFPKRGSPIRILNEIKKIDGNGKDPSSQLHYQISIAGLKYLVHTPALLLSLIVRGHFEIDSMERFLKDPDLHRIAEFSGREGEKILKLYRVALNALSLFEPHLALHSELRDVIATGFEKNAQTTVAALYLMSQKTISEKPLEEWKKDLEGFSKRSSSEKKLEKNSPDHIPLEISAVENKNDAN